MSNIVHTKVHPLPSILPMVMITVLNLKLFLLLVLYQIQELFQGQELPQGKMAMGQHEQQQSNHHQQLEYFGMLRKTRKRYRRAREVRGPLPSEQQIVDHVDEHLGPREYILVKERKPRSTSIKRRKKQGVGKRAVRRRGGRRRIIIDIHLEVLDECQRGDTQLVQEDFFEILVQEFMGSEFIKEKNIPKEEIPSSDSGFYGGRLCS
ncbi:SICA antigen [Plasmodium coatneyi]|uniref:SICA antigen n=1 Tax=Plasmodium coatneyi TaxID=208452 RepID=A0A1B1E142_9APIC|nr:SICA antigen [Plasmodium coatneyi]ANQ08761.1 SICA antigen [Plasmodium coatneyi]